MSSAILYTFGSVALISGVSLVGALVLTLHSSFIVRAMAWLVSFATGAILGSVFFHLVPEAIEAAGIAGGVPVFMLVGLLLAFVIEKFIHWHHCHTTEHDEVDGHHAHPVGPLIIVADGLHNLIDGIVIASAFSVSIPIGLATTLAVILHEIPQELSDVALLLHSGFSKSRAIFWNTISACMAFAGAGIAIQFNKILEGNEHILLSIAAGNLLYVAAVDLIPELHKETRIRRSVLQVFFLIAGISLMGWIAVSLAHEHSTEIHSVEVEDTFGHDHE